MPDAVIAYVPAIHTGYIKFFREHPGDLYLIGSELLEKVPRLDRDIRALDPEIAIRLLEPLNVANRLAIFDPRLDLGDFGFADSIIMPDEDISRAIADQYLTGRSVTYVPAFLRWDKQISTTEFEVSPNRVISAEQFDAETIKLTHHEAIKSPDWWRQVGAAIVQDRQVILLGHNRPLVAADYTFGAFGDPRSNFDAGEYIELSKAIHAEASLIAQAGRTKEIGLDGASIYVTTFPCPNCAKLIAAAGITRVYYDKGYSLLDAEDVFVNYSIEVVKVQS